ncbi:DUF3368 domain-containing protein [Hymenobacter weizhouensis]|uniref:DUF3368 domain-containing protein n=1 Tax=Hymenobacter sp. YIM 151500-1 TaxID=2987689 RepID=UPI002226A854|nr:DUF3368 domain-containing protein [Hymenobacter sp. YIM 151500-1]UYZ63539.1 DUF3368 domain-containing protein [Hymenobacter sp. YIM 151500-1]
MTTTSLPSVIISDTNGLILLTKIGWLELLRNLFSRCFITPIVAAEYGRPLPEWLEVHSPAGSLPEGIILRSIHPGEYSALVLALETPDSLLLLDDAPARQVAQQLQLSHTGTLGLLILAKSRGLLAHVRPVLAELRAAGMWVSDAVAENICQAAGE